MNPTDFLTLRYAVGQALPRLAWRHHGIGCLQAYMHEGESEVRVHIWHPCLTKPGFDHTSGAAHDHRFGFFSRVLLGSLYNERIKLTPNTVGEWTTHYVEHARAAKERIGAFHGSVTGDEGRFDARRAGEWIREGEGYNMAPREFHYSKAADLCVTVVTKNEHVDGSARILRRLDRTLIHAFDGTEHVPLELMQQAHDVLTGVYR